MMHSHLTRPRHQLQPGSVVADGQSVRLVDCLPLLALVLAILVSPLVYDLALVLGLTH